MKNIILLLIMGIFTISPSFSQKKGNLQVGMKAPEWTFTDADKNEFTMNSWPDKVLQVNYVDPDESDLNDAFNDAVKKAADIDNRINRDLFKGFGIVDCKSTWKPNMLIRTIAGNKAKKYNTTILFDYDATLQNLWGLPADSYSVIILDKNRVCRAIYRGKIAEADYNKIIQLIIDLGKE
jgi:predicted transcriptional regulator